MNTVEVIDIEDTIKNDNYSSIDCISRRSAIEAIGDEPIVRSEDGYNLGKNIQWKKDLDAIYSLPSVKNNVISRNEGYWIIREETTSIKRGISRKWIECSECGGLFSVSRLNDNYCSRCGSKIVN